MKAFPNMARKKPKTTTLLTYTFKVEGEKDFMVTPHDDVSMGKFWINLYGNGWGNGDDWVMKDNIVYRVTDFCQGSETLWHMYIPIFKVGGQKPFEWTKDVTPDTWEAGQKNARDKCRNYWKWMREACNEYERGLEPYFHLFTEPGMTDLYEIEDGVTMFWDLNSKERHLIRDELRPMNVFDTYHGDYCWRLKRRRRLRKAQYDEE